MNGVAILVSLTLLMLSSCALPKGDADRLLRAQVVDAETGQPLQGVVVLAYWIKYGASFGGWAGGGFYDSEEVVTGPDGRYAIRPRFSYILPGVSKVSAEIVIFKPGYGRWEYRSAKGEEFVIELPPLKTRDKRLKFYDSLRWSGRVPPERTQRLDEAVKMERAYLGFRN